MEGKIVSHYKIIEKLGGGGMGEVYKAEDIKLKRIVALKFLPMYFSRDEEAKRRFMQEAQTASSLDHPNICTIYEIDETKDFPDKALGRLFIAMAYCEGETLKKKILPRLMNQSDVIELAIQVAKGLVKAHQQGIVHRDIKPANVMITNDGVAKIVDFGLARLASKSEITRPEVTMGTLSYISPEQIQGKQIDHRTDIWSFGVMLYEMLTGELPFRGEIDQAVIYSILNEAPEPFKVTISEQLKRVVQRSLEKNPEDRYQNMEEAIAELQEVEKETVQTQIKKPKPSIAVLPFKNMCEDSEQEYFCDGMAEEIINALTTVRELRVIARTSSFMFKKKDMDIREIGKKLNANMILEGSVRKSDGRLRITAQLINVLDGYHVWSDKFDRTLDDVLTIQDEISLSIVDKLKIRLLENEKKKLTLHGTDNLEAYNLYLLGRFYWAKNSKADLEKAIEYYYKAVEKDENYIMAYYGIVSSYSSLRLYGYSLEEDVIIRARDAAEKVVIIDPDSIATHLTLASFHLNFTWDWELARTELEKVRAKDPDNIYMHNLISGYYHLTGDVKNAILEEELSQEDDPLRIECIIRLGIYYLGAKRIVEARQQFLKVKEMEPDYFYVYWMLGQTYVLESKYNEGIDLLNKALLLSNEHAPILADLGRAYMLAGEKNKTDEIVEKLKLREKKENLHPFLFSVLYAALNQMDDAFRYLEKAIEESDPTILHILTVESIDNIRKDSRFIGVLKKMGLYKYYKQIKNNSVIV
jgi:serine/threonine protein kinase/Tfp pilus assembly protein PilF